MIVIDTHIWFWWMHDLPPLKPWMRDVILANESSGILVSAISLWEIAQAVQHKRMTISRSLPEWFALATEYPGVKIVPLSAEICIAGVKLPDTFHKDPADRIIVATTQVLGCELLTDDGKILRFPGVNLVEPKVRP